MKKCLFLMVLLACLLLCAAALADREISVTTLDGVSGTIKVPDEITLLMEKGGPDGIVCSQSGNTKSFTLSSYQMSQGSVPYGTLGQRVVVVELAPKEITTEKGTPLNCLIPVVHQGTLKSNADGALVLDAFTYSGDPEHEQGMTQQEWEAYKSYISDIDLKYTAEAFTPANDPDHNIDIEKSGTAFDLKIKGNSRIGIDGKLKLQGFHLHGEFQIKYGLEIDNVAITRMESGELSLMIPIPLCELGFTIGGEGNIGASFSEYFEMGLTFNVGFDALNANATASHSSGKADVYGQQEMNVFVGAEIGPMLELEVFSVGINYKLGIDLKYRVYEGHFFVDDDNHYKYHACNSCVYKGIFPQVGPLAAEIKILAFAKGFTLIDPVKLPALVDSYHSFTYGNEGSGSCPLLGYKLDVHVRDQNGKDIKDAEVTYTPTDDKFKDVITAKTNPFGVATVYIPLKDYKDQNAVTVSASVQDPLDPKKSITASAAITEKGIPKEAEEGTPPDPKDLTLTLDTSSQAIYFADSGSGTVTGMPSTIYYHHSQGKANIPDSIPEKSGLVFTGWNTAKDGSGTAVAPGSQFGRETDVTLYAQWDLVAKYYVIQYNANGGEWAPEGQVVPLNQKARLSDQPARWENHKFRGWAETEDAFEAKYPVGSRNEYTPKGDEAVVTLYAVWSFDPVIPPIRVHFDMNGGPQEQAPADQWIENPSWMMIPTKNIHWDEIHYLAGWSKDPNAKTADYFAGRSYYFNDNTTFYAVWNQFPLCKLSFRDPAGGDTANMPEDVLFVPHTSTKVAVPDTIPWKSGRHFTGWNMAADGSGKFVAPGSVIDLTEDTVLYAQWEVVGSNWMVRFNANGGESAPTPQFAKNGEDMRLTTARAVWTNHKFIGWSRSDTASVPDYPVDKENVVPYNPNETALTLYAVWGFDPVVEPIRLRFDMNGGPAGQKPADQRIPAGSWYQLSADIPTWDGQHTFLGWSTDKKSRTAEYKAGSSVSFEEDTVLYAVWKAEYKITEGDGAVWTLNSTDGLKFVADGNFDYFTGVRVGANQLSASQYDASSGSTVIRLKAGYLQTLQEGTYKIRIDYMDGTAEGTFTVKKPVPHTGDSGTPVLWLALALLGLAGLALLAKQKASAKK